MAVKVSAKTMLPPRFQGATLASLGPEFDFVKEYRENLRENARVGTGLVISGPPGVGKTWAVAALTMEWAKRTSRPGSWHFETAPDILEKYRPMGGAAPRDTFRDQSFTLTYNSVKWLVVNDLGKEYRAGKMGEQQVAKIGSLLRARAEQRLITIITTNLPITPSVLQTVESVYGESVWSLLHECTHGYTVIGPDRRLRD